MRQIAWPEGRKFAFTMFDDTDFARLEPLREVYAFLADHGILTTKSVWPLRGRRRPVVGGATCEDPAYLRWVLELQQRGFEIALHNVAYSTSERGDTIRGFDRFRELFGHDPFTLANHTGCAEGIYWGTERLTGIHRTIYNVVTRNRRKDVFQGHIESSPLFWGDLCRERVRYVRNFVYPDVNTLKACPQLPYRDPARPFVNAWFASSEGPRVEIFTETLAEENQDRLAAEGGACIMYTHLGQDFHDGNCLNPRFTELMIRLSRMGGWFVPTRTLLDYLAEGQEPHVLTAVERRRLERRWLWARVRALGRV